MVFSSDTALKQCALYHSLPVCDPGKLLAHLCVLHPSHSVVKHALKTFSHVRRMVPGLEAK